MKNWGIVIETPWNFCYIFWNSAELTFLTQGWKTPLAINVKGKQLNNLERKERAQNPNIRLIGSDPHDMETKFQDVFAFMSLMGIPILK